MGKDSHFTGQPMYSQVLKLLDREKIMQISCDTAGSEAYVNPDGLVTHIDQRVRFTRRELTHNARRVEIFEEKKKPVVLLTNNFPFIGGGGYVPKASFVRVDFQPLIVNIFSMKKNQ